MCTPASLPWCTHRCHHPHSRYAHSRKARNLLETYLHLHLGESRNCRDLCNSCIAGSLALCFHLRFEGTNPFEMNKAIPAWVLARVEWMRKAPLQSKKMQHNATRYLHVSRSKIFVLVVSKPTSHTFFTTFQPMVPGPGTNTCVDCVFGAIAGGSLILRKAGIRWTFGMHLVLSIRTYYSGGQSLRHHLSKKCLRISLIYPSS